MGVSWTALAKISKKNLFIFGIGVFVGWSVAVGGGTISPEEKSLLKLYMYNI